MEHAAFKALRPRSITLARVAIASIYLIHFHSDACLQFNCVFTFAEPLDRQMSPFILVTADELLHADVPV